MADIAFFETALRRADDVFTTPCRSALLARLSGARTVQEPADKPKRDCANSPDVLGTHRTIEIDATGSPAYGRIKDHKPLDLADKEIVLTFDDGPHPTRTREILDILDDHCVKATFFVVGRAAKRRPEFIRDTYERGHTLAGHTYSHKYFPRITDAEGKAQIDDGENALRDVLTEVPHRDRPDEYAQPAPFFRFPGLQETKSARAYLKETDRAIFSFDICTEDWRRIKADKVYSETMRCAKKRGRGIMIFHDTKEETVKALPRILKSFKEKGYKVVHMVPKENSAVSSVSAGEVHPVSAKTPK
jgi:peptidoglycan/xylan/chitin deacetylase (PgdA/CDA1 family)